MFLITRLIRSSSDVKTVVPACPLFASTENLTHPWQGCPPKHTQDVRRGSAWSRTDKTTKIMPTYWPEWWSRESCLRETAS